MRIAYLCTDFGIPVYGCKGASIHVRSLSQALTDLGHDITIYATRAGQQRPPDFSVPVREIAPDKVGRLVIDALRDDPDGGELIAREVRSMVHAAALAGRLLSCFAKKGPDTIYERYSLFGTAGMVVARELGIPLVLEVNAPLSFEQEAHRGLAFSWAADRIEHGVLCAADRLVAVTEALAAWLTGIGVASERIAVVPNGVDVDRFGENSFREETRFRLGLSEQPVVGFVGTLKPWHGTESLIRAVATVHRRGAAKPALVIVGDGPERDRLEELAAQEGIAGVTIFVGAVPHESIASYLAAMDLAVAPYDDEPSFYFSPLKLFEYMAAGRPVVAAAAGQIESVIDDGRTGLLYPPGNVEALAARIERLILDPALAASMGRAAQRHVREHHTWRRSARTVVEVIEKVSGAPAMLAGAR